jgi:hypothetical protein
VKSEKSKRNDAFATPFIVTTFFISSFFICMLIVGSLFPHFISTYPLPSFSVIALSAASEKSAYAPPGRLPIGTD